MSVSSDSVAYDPVKTKLLELETEAKEPTNHKARNRAVLFVYSPASASDSNLFFTPPHRSKLLITTPSETPSALVKTSENIRSVSGPVTEEVAIKCTML